MEVIKGYIDHFVYQNESNGYTVFELATDDGSLTCVGNMSGYGSGAIVELTGEFVNHPVYDRQFKVRSVKELPPEDKVAVMRYLGSGAIKGIGEALAKRIVDKFGDDTFRIAQEEPERLAEIKGISIKKAYDIGAQLAEKRDLRDAMIFLQKYGITQTLANKIYAKYGMEMYTVMQENPYRLAEDIGGVGFKTADEIAMKNELSVAPKFRIRCALIYLMGQIGMDGHCYYPYEKMVEKTLQMLGDYDESDVEPVVTDLLVDKKLIMKVEDDVKKIYLPVYYYGELGIAERLTDLYLAYEHMDSGISKDSWMKKIQRIEKEDNIILDELQRQAVAGCMMEGVFILSGGPGTGKTTTINTLLKLLVMENENFMLAAPTGRAAKRMQETTGFEAKTIHRLLEVSGEIQDDKRGARFEKNEENPLEADVIIVDEMSMVDVHLFGALLKAIMPGTRLILVGDANQLSSVGPGQVLKDILSSKIYPSICLEKIFRQDEDSHIVSYAYKINAGEELDLDVKYKDFFLLEKNDPETIYRYIGELMTVNIPKSLGYDSFEVQVLTPMRKGSLGTMSLNGILQKKLNPEGFGKKEHIVGDTCFREGDKIIQIRNNYDMEWEIIGKYNITVEKGKGIYNGDIGKIKEINEHSRTMLILFDDNKSVYYPFENLEDIELAYAMTVHKSQGGEYPVIIMPLLSGPQMLFTRNLLYTGVTRARECVILLGSKQTVNDMIKNDKIKERYTELGRRCKECYSRMAGVNE